MMSIVKNQPAKGRAKFQPLTDKTPKYTVKEVAEMMELSPYAVRFYDNSKLIPDVSRNENGVRMFSDYAVSWLRLIHCLRTTGLSIEGVKHYIDLCLEGDATIPERAELIFRQEKILRDQIRVLKKQMEVLKYKKTYYENLLAGGKRDSCNPATRVLEPNVIGETFTS